MICEQLTTLLGFDCTPLTEAGDVALVSTPFTFEDGDSLPVYVQMVRGQVRFFDDGQTLMHFLGRGVRIENKKQSSFLSTATSRHGAAFTESGNIEVWAPAQQAGEAFRKYIASMMDITSWERDQQGINTDMSVFVEEVAIALQAWRPQSDIKWDPLYEGISNRVYKLDLAIDGEGVAVTGSHANAVSAVLHKLIDIHSRIANKEKKFLVVIDDREDPEAASREALIMQSVATVMPYTALEAKGRATSSIH